VEGVPCDAEGGGNDSETDERVFESCPRSFCEAGCVGGRLESDLPKNRDVGCGSSLRGLGMLRLVDMLLMPPGFVIIIFRSILWEGSIAATRPREWTDKPEFLESALNALQMLEVEVDRF